MVLSVSGTHEELLEEVQALDRRATMLTNLGSVPDPSTTVDGDAGRRQPVEAGVFDLVRTFVERVSVGEPGLTGWSAVPAAHALDWDAVRAAVASARSLEQAAGRAVLVALRMRREAMDAHGPDARPPTGNRPVGAEHPETTAAWCIRTDDPFFAFSVADVVPDFGDQSRYRSRLARRVSRVIRIGRRPGDRGPAGPDGISSGPVATTAPATPE